MSIVRVGLSESDGFDEGYDAIFGKKDPEAQKDEGAQAKTKAKSEKKDDKKKKDKKKK